MSGTIHHCYINECSALTEGHSIKTGRSGLVQSERLNVIR